jgi:beta-N-acetylhexosaminidase
MNIGRLLMIGIEQSAWDKALEELLEEIQPGGVIFFNRNTQGGAEGFQKLAARVREVLEYPVVLAADVEGGTVDRFRDLLGPFPAPAHVAQAHDDPLVRRFGSLVGEAFRAFGLNANLAPVLDLASPLMDTRAAGDKPDAVVRFARNFLEGLAGQEVLGCGKHFPGLGGGTVDTHAEMAVIEKSAEELWEQDLAPFRELAPSLPMVMMSHAFYPGLEPQGTAARPASMSPHLIGDLLRGKLGFSGAVLSDDLEMGAALVGRTVGEAAVASIAAGCDLVLVCHQPDRMHAACEALLMRADSDDEFAVRAEAANKAVEALAGRLAPGPKAVDLAELKHRITQLGGMVESMGALSQGVPDLTVGTGFVKTKPRRPPGEGHGGGRGRGPRQPRRDGGGPRRGPGHGGPGGPGGPGGHRGGGGGSGGGGRGGRGR